MHLSIAVEYSYKVQLEKHNAHVPLLKLLQSPDADVQVRPILNHVQHAPSQCCNIIEKQCEDPVSDGGALPEQTWCARS